MNPSIGAISKWKNVLLLKHVSLKYQRFTLPNNKECVANAQNYKIDDKALKGVTGYIR